MTKLAFIGLGSMGRPLARLLARSAPDIAVFDPFADALNVFEGTARLASSPADAVAGADAVGVCVRDEAQVRDVLFGADGVASSLSAGSLVLIHSTISVEAIRDISERLQAQGIAIVDAPVSRTRRTDDEAFVYSMLGGEEQDVTRAQAIVAAFSTDVKRMGPLGAGMATKIANNLVTWVQIIVGAQGSELAVANGVDIAGFLDVMKANGNLTPTMGAMLSGKFQAQASPERDQFAASQAGIGEKDLALALAGASAVGMNPGMIDSARAAVRDAMTRRLDHPVVHAG